MRKEFRSLAVLSAFFVVFAFSWHTSHAAFACTDSDGGRSYFVKGVAISNGQSQEDFCLDEFALVEKYCSGSVIGWEHYSCPAGCRDGACISQGISITGDITGITGMQTATTQITISGYVRTSAGTPVGGVTVESLDATSSGGCPIGPPARGSATTSSSGYYSFTFPQISGYCNYVITTPSKSGCIFSPANNLRQFTGANVNQDFTATCSSVTPSISYTRTPATIQSSPFKAGDTTTLVLVMTPWTSLQGKDWILRSRTTDVVTGTVTSNPDFLAGWSDIASLGLCDSTGRCTSAGTWQASQFSCNGINTNNVRKVEEWVIVNGVESQHGIYYYRCSDTVPTCTDSDNSNTQAGWNNWYEGYKSQIDPDNYIQGHITGYDLNSIEQQGDYGFKDYYDVCIYFGGSYKLSERYCYDNGKRMGGRIIDCPCSNGACIQLSIRDAKYTQGTGPGSDSFNITIVNNGGEINLSNYQLIFTGNGYSIAIGGVSYRLKSIAGILPSGSTKEIRVEPDYNPLINTGTQCGNSIKVGLIKYGGTSANDMVTLQDLILTCIRVCTEGQTKQCGVSNTGTCRYGTSTCTNGIWSVCTGYIGPTTEICGNNIDDDCDGQVDENCQTQTCTDSDNSQDYSKTTPIASGGQDKYTKGTVKWVGYPDATDICVNINNNEFLSSCTNSASIRCGVQEYYCYSGGRGAAYIDCPNGCYDGACLQTQICTEGNKCIINDGQTAIITTRLGDYSVRNVGVSSATVAVISVNGVAKAVTKGSTYTISGVYVYISDIYYFTSSVNQPNKVALTLYTVEPTCTNECSYDFQMECLGGPTFRVCGYYDGDSCLEWEINNCTSGYVCANNNSCVPATQTCTDSDGGMNYYLAGTAKGIQGFADENSNAGSKYVEFSDYCLSSSSNAMMEFYCGDNGNGGNWVKMGYYYCPNGCSDGACMQSTNTDLEIKNLRKGTFHQYGFLVDVCIYGDKSINELKSTIPSLTNLPGIYRVKDSSGNFYSDNSNSRGVIEDYKNGQCFNGLGFVVQSQYQSIFDSTGYLEMILDSNNIIPEKNESNNKATYQGAVINSCTDSDGGLNYYVKGTLSINNNNWIDTCCTSNCASSSSPTSSSSGPYLKEYYCLNSTQADGEVYTCPNGCYDGACLQTQICTEGNKCIINDGQTATITSRLGNYMVRNVGVSSSTIAVISVNGINKEVMKGSTYTIAGVYVYISDIYYFASTVNQPNKVAFTLYTTAPSCMNECDYDFQMECLGGPTFRVCGYYDGDSCLEWQINNCTSGYVCADNNSCVPATQTCTESQLRCNPGNSKQIQKCKNSQWAYNTTCTYGCNNGTITCNTNPSLCTAAKEGQFRCNPSSATQVQKCTNGRWALSRICISGQTCNNGECQTTARTPPSGGGSQTTSSSSPSIISQLGGAVTTVVTTVARWVGVLR